MEKSKKAAASSRRPLLFGPVRATDCLSAPRRPSSPLSTTAIYGVVTGTVSCGLLLLRIVDPDFKTPVAYEHAVMNVFSLPVVGGCTVLVNGPLWWGWPLWVTILVFAGIMAVVLTLMKLMGLLDGASPAVAVGSPPK